ncbi:DNA protecting protein DprA [Solidesulfovibrio carbinoliphilus subsp. oakridgensis]|uniref:DNA protecting protein DprA n=1 Tax=Solidesulfovibrio carbinoliphilus subsp. oakridgensis TaxID=694327 RepID=G7QAQ3_9BACT|nr:DNA-processing protein DprA [Solidesulfovibrio carbinoliphilus]EHJ49284.1 DNA protecting protein DprA [Solidesulfovibrio carbinoliphilus subsp. oakridgensis]
MSPDAPSPPASLGAPAARDAWTADDGFLAELEACLRLRNTPGLGPRTWKRIFDRYPSAAEALADVRAFGAQGLCDDAVAGTLARGLSIPAARREMEAAAAKGLLPIPYFHAAYPARLRELPDPPAVLYVVGDARLLGGPSVAMVGARQCSRYGFAAAFDIASGLAASGITVVSGLAFGIDRQAHLGGLTGPGRSVAVCGTGLDLVYPDANMDVWRALAEDGAIVSEFAPGTPPQAQNFPIRNRVIAGLSLGVMVVEAASRSGSLITARLALEQGREVFALPGPVNLPTYAGCHALLSQGARLVQTADDIVAALARELGACVDAPRPAPPVRPAKAVVRAVPVARTGERARPAGPKVRPAAPPAPGRRPAPAPLPDGLSDLEAAIAGLLGDGSKRHIDALATALGAPSGPVSQALVLLEMKGLVRKWPGMYYTRDVEG